MYSRLQKDYKIELLQSHYMWNGSPAKICHENATFIRRFLQLEDAKYLIINADILHSAAGK